MVDTTRAPAESIKLRARQIVTAQLSRFKGTANAVGLLSGLENQASAGVPQGAKSQKLTAILRTLQGAAGATGRVSIGDLIDALGSRSFGPLLLVPSLILITPLSGIPGGPTIGAIVIVLVATQLLFGRSTVWMPAFVRNRTLRRERVRSIAERLQPAARVIDRITGRRMTFLTRRPFNFLLVAPCIALALAMPPLEFVPMSSTILASGVFVLALSLTAQDGLLGFVSLVVTTAAIVLAVTLIFLG
jgi:hypothetical protein